MQINLGGKIPSLDVVDALFAIQPDEFWIENVAIDLDQGNIEWDDMLICWGGNNLHIKGHCGLKDLIMYDEYSYKEQRRLLSDLHTWIRSEYRDLQLELMSPDDFMLDPDE